METFLECFHAEAAERLERLSSGLIALEQSPDDATLIGDLFREAHSLKGAAGVTGLADVAEICHKMEDLLSELRSGNEQASPLLIDALLGATDAVRKLVGAEVGQQGCDVVPAAIIEKFDKVEDSEPDSATEAESELGEPSGSVGRPATAEESGEDSAEENFEIDLVSPARDDASTKDVQECARHAPRDEARSQKTQPEVCTSPTTSEC